MRGDLEAQRHWLSLTSSALVSSYPSLSPLAPSLEASVPVAGWYFASPGYWALDYPPLTAYHSFLVGSIARVSSRESRRYVEARPDEGMELEAWEERMRVLEKEGGMKVWLRASVLVGDLLVWVSAVRSWCRRNYRNKGRGVVVSLVPIIASSVKGD